MSRSAPAEPRVTLVVAALAVLVFSASWGALHVGFYTRDQIVDTPVYQRYGDAMARGQVPYRDFGLEYPPGALPMFVLPALGHHQVTQFESFRRSFERLMWACGVLMLVAMAFALHALGASARRTAAAPLFAALAPLALGSVVLSRFDLWPAAIVAAALAAIVSGRLRLGHALLGLGIAAKVYPAVLVPLALVHVWRRRGRREALICLGFLLAAIAVVVVPFLALAPGGVWASVVRQTTRPLQIESLGAAILIALHHAAGLAVTMRSSHGSQNLDGTGPNVIGSLQTVLQIAALLAIWALYARGRAGREELVRYSATAVVAFVALGKVFSPQFLIWLVPLVPLVRGRRGLAASGLLLVAMVLTQLWFPYRYWDYALHFDATASWLVLVRDLVMLALLFTLALPRREGALE
ncbi:MAG: glycosyltransferase 87 family protein [Gaiellaceae bacterium]